MQLKPELLSLLAGYGLNEGEIADLASRLDNVASSYEAQAAGFQSQIDNAAIQRDEARPRALSARNLIARITVAETTLPTPGESEPRVLVWFDLAIRRMTASHEVEMLGPVVEYRTA